MTQWTDWAWSGRSSGAKPLRAGAPEPRTWRAWSAQMWSSPRPAPRAPLWRQVGEKFSAIGREFVRRHGLAFQPRPAGVRGPALGQLLGELRTPYELWQASRAERMLYTDDLPRGESRPVMILPGFGTHPARMGSLTRALEFAGHRVSDWGLGFNFGATEDRIDRLCERVQAMARKEGAPLVLVGWSLGGLFAREVAHRIPESVAMVVTMGSPFSGDRRANNAWRAYQLICGHTVDAPPVECNFAVKPPVPTVALWSPRDGIVAPRSARGRAGERDLAISVRCTHLGFAGHPEVARAVIRVLAAG